MARLRAWVQRHRVDLPLVMFLLYGLIMYLCGYAAAHGFTR